MAKRGEKEILAPNQPPIAQISKKAKESARINTIEANLYS